MTEQLKSDAPIPNWEITHDFLVNGELVIHFPDGTNINTRMLPTRGGRMLLQRFFGSTLGQTILHRLHEQATHDDMTRLMRQAPARACFEQHLLRLCDVRFEGMVSLIMLDLDHFGQVNKQYGNPVGDNVLRRFADIMRQSIHIGDLLSRWGGEEFLILAAIRKEHETEHARSRDPSHASATSTVIARDEHQLMSNGRRIGDRIRKKTEAEPFVFGKISIPVTVTVGVANVYIDPNSRIEGLFDKLLEIANEQLYAAKRADTRNTVNVATTIMAPSLL